MPDIRLPGSFCHLSKLDEEHVFESDIEGSLGFLKRPISTV
jgi:hypothetical protein